MIERDGVEQLSLAQVAAALGIKAPSLYRHVASKTALIAAVNTWTSQELFGAFQRALAEADRDPTARLGAIFHAQRRFAHANPRTYVLMFTTADNEQRANAEMLEQQALPIQAIMALLVGAERALTALRGALALVHGFVMLELNAQFQRGGDLDAAFEATISAYLAGWSNR